MTLSHKLHAGLRGAALLLAASSALAQSAGNNQANANGSSSITHVLLISIDGMHALDFINCVNGIAGANGSEPFCPNLSSLKPTGVN